jgi:hypothetical protein
MLLEGGLVLAAIVLGKALDFPAGYVLAAILAGAFLVAWYLGKDEDEEEFDSLGLFPEGTPAGTSADLDTSAPSPSSTRPLVLGARYGTRASDNRCGLFIVNDGDTAYDVTIKNARFRESTLIFHAPTIGRLDKSDGELLCETWIQQSPNTGLLGNGLFQEMVAQKVEEFEIEIKYKDAANVYYRTLVVIERDVLAPGGLVVRYSGQSVVPKSVPYVITEKNNIFHFHPIESTDPQIYVEVIDEKDFGIRVTDVELINRGGSVAHDVQLTLYGPLAAQIKFVSVDTIAPNKSERVRPDINDVPLFGQHNLVVPISESWTKEGKGQTEHKVMLEVSYRDVTAKHRYSTSACLVFYPLEEARRLRTQGKWPNRSYTVLAVKNTQIQRRVPVIGTF